MQMCPNCGKVYDESEFTHCPYCYGWSFLGYCYKDYNSDVDYDEKEEK